MGTYRCLYDKEGNYLGNYYFEHDNNQKPKTEITQYEFLEEYSNEEINKMNLSKNEKWRTFKNQGKK